MSSPPLVEWDSSLFSDLQHLLGRVVTQPTTSSLRKLYGKLEEAQPWLLNLTQLPGQNDADKQHIEKNPLQLPSGTSVHITGDLLNTTNTISNALSLSQLFSAVLALQAEEQRFQYPSRSTPEVAVYLLHRWEADMLDFLRELLRTVLSSDVEIGGAFENLKEWVLELLNTRVSLGGQGKGEGALVDQIIVQLDNLQNKIDNLLRTGSAGGADYDLLRFRVEALRAEQNKMSSILAIIAESGHLGRGQVVRILKWLKKCERADGLAVMIVSALFAAWKPLEAMDASDPRYDVAEDWCHDIKFLKIVSSLTIQDQWSIPKLRETVKIAWSLFYLSCLRHDPSVVQTGIDAHQMEQFLLEAVNAESFQFTYDLVLNIRRERGLEESDEVKEANLDALVKVAIASDPSNDIFLFEQLRDLVDLLAGRKQFLRTLRNKEEDASVRRTQSTPPAANYQGFLALVAIVYKSLPPDSADELWDNSTFLGTVLDTRGGFPGPAFWEMLAAISTGPSCSAKSYEKMKDTRLPWTALFKFYQHYIDIMPHIYEPIKTTRNTSLDPMPQDEAQICNGWTKVLTTVVRWSPAARGALLQAKPHPLQTLFDFLNCENLPFELKATILGAITAFCRRTGDPIDDDVLSKAVEFYEKITFRDPGLDIRHLEASKIPPPVGWLAKMEYSEQDASSYPLSRAYVDFLTSLLPDPATSDSPISSRGRLVNTLRRGTFYILDGILLTLKTRRYARDSERWEVIDSLSAFFEKALLSFNMGELLNQGNSRAIGQIASTLAEEPGFIVLLRLLSDANVFAVFASVLDNASATPSPRPTIVNDVLLRMLRIYHRIHDIQLVFVDVLLLTLSDPTRNPTNPFKRPYGLQSLDNHLLAHLSNINAIALLVGDDDSAISYLSVKIIAALAQSPVFSRSDVFRGEYTSSVNRLAGIIDASDDSIRIAQGFCRKLEAEDEDIEDIPAVEDTALHGDIKSLSSLPVVIRSNILDILVEGTTADITSPNIAHFLLGYDFRHRDFALQDGESCLHVILRQLCEGAELRGAVGETMINIHPLLAAKSAQLVYQLFAHPLTGRSTLSYTMSVTGFSARQLASFPRQTPEASQPTGIARTFDEEIPTTSETLIAYLNFQRWILSAAALETFTYDGHGASANHIAQTLFRGTTEEEDLDEDELVSQNPALIIDLLSSIDVQWSENVEEENRNLEFYGGFDFDQYKRVDADWWDLEALSRGLKAFRRQLERQGAVTAASTKSMAAEAEYVIKRLGSKNRETDISIAKGNFLTSWNEILKVSLAMLFKNIAEEQQEIVLFDLIDALLLRLEGDLAPGVLDLLCESVLVTMTTLINILVEFEGVNLPIDRLSATLARIIDSAVRPGSTESARGNLYASITQYLQLVNNSSFNIPDDRSVISTATLSGGSSSSTSALQKPTLAVFAARKERLLPILCRDAMDDREVWKTECFALLNGITSICSNERDRHIISPLMSNGYLPLFVRSIKERELSLQECLSPEHANLHAYWVFEAKIAFLVALASTRKGAEDLLDAGIFEIFATCGFINIQIGEDVMDEAAASEIISRQHRVLICSLQLLTRVLSSLHRSARSGAGHALSFLNAHRESILGLLRETQQTITSTGIEESRLIVSILCMVVHKVPSEDIHSPTGFGAFHLATLATAARFFDRDSWIDEVDSQGETEILLLNQVFLSYLTAATNGMKGGNGNPVLVTGAQRSNGSSSKYIASAPSLHMAVNMLSDLAENVQEVSNQYETILDRIQDGGELEDEDVQKLQTPDMIGDEPLSEDIIKAAFVTKSQAIFNMIESLLLLIWRHLLFYANDARGALEPVRPNNLSASLGSFGNSQAQLEASRSSAGTIRMLERVSASLKGTLVRLDDMEVNLELRRLATTSSTTSKGSDAYYGMLVRRLKELTAGLTGSNSSMEED